jgi:transposase
MRDELGSLFTDADFLALYPRRGQPAFSPWRLALVTIMQFVENLSDRQAAEAVRARIDWKYALSLELDDPGFDFSLLSEFRDRLATNNPQSLLLDRMLELLSEKKLLKGRGRQRTDSTHVLAAIRVMNRLELVTETLRAALNDLATEVPDWLRGIAPAEWYTRYSVRAEQTRLPQGDKARQEFAETVGRDGFRLLDLVTEQKPLRQPLDTVETLRLVWERHFGRSDKGEVIWRPEAQLSKAATSIESPYEPQARHSNKHELCWTGYKVHLTETCEADLPHVITHVYTTEATTQDVSCTAQIQQGLADKELLPDRQLVDTGYIDADLLVSSRETHQVQLLGPPREGQSWQAREGGYDQTKFTIDWDQQQAICPEGKVSSSWGTYETKPYQYRVVKVRFRQSECAVCPSRAQCVRSEGGQSRTLVLPEHAQYEALQRTRGHLSTEEGRSEYKKRAGVEGTLSQGVRRSDLRHCRYIGLAKTHLQHVATAVAMNIIRVTNFLNEVPLAPTRQSRFARLCA